jgi:hypothetical protein
MKTTHNHINEISELADQFWGAFTDEFLDCDIEVIPVGNDTFILIDKEGFTSFWQEHGDWGSFHSDTLCEMSDQAQFAINEAIPDIEKDNSNFILHWNL